MAARIDWPALTRAHPELSFLPALLCAAASVHDFDRGETVFRLGARPLVDFRDSG